MRVWTWLWVSICGWLVSLGLPSPSSRFLSSLARLDDFVDELMKCREVPGLTLGVVTADEVLLSRGYGKANLETGTPVDSRTRFGVASLTKAFTATVAGILLKEKGLSWDTPIQDILSDCCEFPSDHMTKSVTVRDLLLHRTGLPRYDTLWISNTINSDQIFKRIKCMQPSAEFRTQGVYNNIMYALVGHVVAALAPEGQDWAQVVTSQILEPLGMRDTTFLRNTTQKDPTVATGYEKGSHVPLKNEDIVGANHIAPAIAMFSNSDDMIKWLQLQLNKGKRSDGKQVVPVDIIAETHRPQVSAASYINTVLPPAAPVSLTYNEYGLAWYYGHYRGNISLMHYGSFPGYYSLITLLPDLPLGIFSSFNGGIQDYSFTINTILHTYIMDIALGETPWQDNLNVTCLFGNSHWTMPSASSSTTTSSASLTGDHNSFDIGIFVGKYGHAVFGMLSVTHNRTLNELYLTYGKIQSILTSDSSLPEGVFNAASGLEGNPFGVWGTVTFSFEGVKVKSVLVPFLAWKFDPEFTRLPTDGATVTLQYLMDTCNKSDQLSQNVLFYCIGFLSIYQLMSIFS